MASPSQLRDGFCLGPPRGSTSQMCLHKILRIITTVPPPLSTPLFSCSGIDESSLTVNDSKNGNKGSGLNESNKNEEAKKSLSLLIEAAKLIFGEFEDINDDDDKSEPKETISLSPVVRSKRGRIQILPHKYRDSVIEPLTRGPTKRTRR